MTPPGGAPNHRSAQQVSRDCLSRTISLPELFVPRDMNRSCAVCGKAFEAQRPNAQFCGATCRKRRQRGAALRPGQGRTPVDYSLVHVTRAELEAAGRSESWEGQLLLVLCERMCECQSASEAASLSRQLRSATAAALPHAAEAGNNFVDELRARRDAKRPVT